MFSCGSKAGLETPALLVHGIVNNAMFHFSPHINQMSYPIHKEINKLINGNRRITFSVVEGNKP